MNLTKLEKSWILYDVGNSAFTLLLATILPLYFNELAASAGLTDVQYLAYWGYAASIATLLNALLAPTVGAMADYLGYKKPLFAASLALGVLGCLLLGLPSGWLLFLVIFVIAKVGYTSSLLFYDAMLPDVTAPGRMDYVSSLGYGWGYLGSCIPFAGCLLLILQAPELGLSPKGGMALSFSLVALWWGLCSIPLLQRHRQLYYMDHQPHLIRASLGRLWNTLKTARSKKPIFLFLLAYFCYIDGVYTIIDMAMAYGSALGLPQNGLLWALLVTQLAAFPSALLFGRLSQTKKTSSLITVSIVAYLGIAIFAMFLHSQWQFWVLAVLVGLFQGGIQALSRSYFAAIVPPETAGEYFGLMDICSKGAAFVGTTLVATVTELTASLSLGVASLAPLFLLGLLLFRKSARLTDL